MTSSRGASKRPWAWELSCSFHHGTNFIKSIRGQSIAGSQRSHRVLEVVLVFWTHLALLLIVILTVRAERWGREADPPTDQMWIQHQSFVWCFVRNPKPAEGGDVKWISCTVDSAQLQQMLEQQQLQTHFIQKGLVCQQFSPGSKK